MNTKKFYLGLAVIIGILCIPMLGEVEPDLPDATLLGQPNPVLEGIDNLFVTIIHPGGNLNELISKNLKAEINHKLSKAGIKVFSPEPDTFYKLPIFPELKIRVDMVELEQSQQYVFHIETLMAKNIYVKTKPALHQKVDVWKTEPVMQAISEQDMPAKVTNVVMEQIEEFIHAYLAANPPGKHVPDKNDIGIILKEQPKPVVKSTQTEYKYVASKNSNVFHSPDCSSAKRIKPENLIGYKSRNEAINAGKRPCKRCKP